MLFKEYREKIGTQAELAKLIKVTQATISFWEKGISYPRPPIARKLANLFGITVDDLYSSIAAATSMEKEA